MIETKDGVSDGYPFQVRKRKKEKMRISSVIYPKE
jgi:hypothetical protein